MPFLLSVAGHTTQKDSVGEEEEDGKDECNCIPYLFSLALDDLNSFDNDSYRDL